MLDVEESSTVRTKGAAVLFGALSASGASRHPGIPVDGVDVQFGG